MERKAIGKRLRFEIFDRDSFTCQYCGKCPPDVQLEIDHIIAVSTGGTNDPENLRTSCVACNLGKTNKPLGKTANDQDSRRRAQEALEAVSTAKKFSQASNARSKLRQQVAAFACGCMDKEQCRNTTVSSIIRALEFHDCETIQKWFDLSVRKTSLDIPVNEDRVMKYFHGILRRVQEQAAANV